MALDKYRAATAVLKGTPTAKPENTPTQAAGAPSPVPTTAADPNLALAWCLSQNTHRRPCPPAGGGRNNWLAALAAFCNERGIPLAVLLTWAETAPELAGHDDKHPGRIAATVQGIYERDAARHNTKPYTAPNPRRGPIRTQSKASVRVDKDAAEFTTSQDMPTDTAAESAEPSTDPISESNGTPLIPEFVYESLPAYLQNCCHPFEGRKRDVLLTGALTVLSGCFPTLGGVYDGERFSANLFSFTVAPAASGKGALKWARALVQPHHRALVQASKMARATFEANTDAYRATIQKGRKAGIAPVAAPEPPPYRQLLIPANNSAAGVVKVLAENDGHGIICEPEADTLAESLKQDWGNFSDLLRVCFDQTHYTYQRKGGEHYELERPGLSVALTGTPAQVARLIPSAENGLFSRFMFYTFEAEAVWRDVSPAATRVPYDQHFAPLAEQVSRMITATTDVPLSVELTADQWGRVNKAGQHGLADVLTQAEQDAAGVAFRLSLSAFRIVLLLTLLRTFEEGEGPTGVLACTDADLTAALTLADIYRAHALVVLDHLSAHQSTSSNRWAERAEKKRRALELHAQGFSLSEIARLLGIGKTTVHSWVNE